MNRYLRRTLTGIGAGTALLGMVSAVQAVVSPKAPARPLQAALATQQKTLRQLHTAVQQAEAEDRQAKAQIGTLKASVQAEKAQLAAEAARARAQPPTVSPPVQSVTGASGGRENRHHRDDAGFGSDD